MSSIKIVADQQILFANEVFSEFGKVELISGRAIDKETVKDADVLLVRSVSKVNESLLNTSKVSFVGTATSGIDHVDTEYLKKSNIAFTSAPGSNARSVAEYILSSLLVLSECQGFKLTDKTIGIIGCGQVGSKVKQFMEALGVTCLINDPPLAKNNSEYGFVELEDIFRADIITLHVPLISDGGYPTEKLLDNDFLSKLKTDVTIINTSRGEVLDEDAIIAFKEVNPGMTLILDVWCNEPNIDINLMNKTFIATPHIAGYSYGGKLKATEMLFEALNEHLNLNLDTPGFLKTKPEIFEVNDDEIQLPVLHSYDVRSDATMLRHLSNLKNNERADYFDELRKSYPVRREFTNRIIRGDNLSEGTKQKLLNIGFNLDS